MNSLILKSFPNAKDAFNLITSIEVGFKQQFQRNPLPDIVFSTTSRPSLHGEGGAYALNPYGKMLSPKKKNDFGGTMTYKPITQDTSEVVLRWDETDAKAIKDMQWIKEYVNNIKVK